MPPPPVRRTRAGGGAPKSSPIPVLVSKGRKMTEALNPKWRHTAEHGESAPSALFYSIDALVREDKPDERVRADAGDATRLAAELRRDASLRVAFHKLPGSNRIEGQVGLFGTAAEDVSARDLKWVFGSTLFLGEQPTAGEPLDRGLPQFDSAYELVRVVIAPAEHEQEPDAFDMRSDLVDRFPPQRRPTYAAPTTDGWDSTAYQLKMMAQSECELLAWTDLGPATDLEQEMVVDELNAIYTYAGLGRNTGSVLRARTVIAARGLVPPMVRAALSRRSRELRLQQLDPAEAVRLWNDPVPELAGHAVSQTHAEALVGVPGVWGLKGVGMPTRERAVPDRALDPMPLAPSRPIRLGWARDAFEERADVMMDVDDCLRHTLVIGASGAGKTTTISQLVIELMGAGAQAIYFDPHGDGAERVVGVRSKLPMSSEVLYIRHGDRAHPARMNPLSEEDEERREQATAELLELIAAMIDPNKTGMFGELGKRLFTVIADGLREVLGMHTSISDVLAVAVDRDKIVALRDAIREKNPGMAQRLQSEILGLSSSEYSDRMGWFASRLQPFLRTPVLREILGSGAKSIDLLSAIDAGQSLIIDLGSLQIGEEPARVLGALWLLELLNAIARRADRSRPVVVVVDEAHLYTFGALPKLLAQARKFGVGVVIATQSPENLSPELARAIEANVGSVVTLRVGIDQAEAAARRLGGWPVNELSRLPDLTAATSLSRGGVPTTQFTLHVDYFQRQDEAGWTSDLIEQAAETAYAASVERIWSPFRAIEPRSDAAVLARINEFSKEDRAGARAESLTDRTEDARMRRELTVLQQIRARQAQLSVAQTEEHDGLYDLILLQRGDQLIQVVKEIRDVTGLGLAESKMLADNVGGAILRGVPWSMASQLADRLKLVGANANIVEAAGEGGAR